MNTRMVQLPYRGTIEVQGEGATTYWRDPSDTTSPFAGRWLLASPGFRADIEKAEQVEELPPLAGEMYTEWPPFTAQ